MFNPMVVPVSEDEILILGGKQYKSKKSQVSVYSVSRKTLIEEKDHLKGGHDKAEVVRYHNNINCMPA